MPFKYFNNNKQQPLNKNKKTDNRQKLYYTNQNKRTKATAHNTYCKCSLLDKRTKISSIQCVQKIQIKKKYKLY